MSLASGCYESSLICHDRVSATSVFVAPFIPGNKKSPDHQASVGRRNLSHCSHELLLVQAPVGATITQLMTGVVAGTYTIMLIRDEEVLTKKNLTVVAALEGGRASTGSTPDIPDSDTHICRPCSFCTCWCDAQLSYGLLL